MAWTRVDDGFLGHPKVTRAAERLGRWGLGRVLVIWHQGQAHASRYLTDGILSRESVARFHDDPKPLVVAEALAEAGLWETVDGGYRIHDYLDYNLSAAEVERKKEADRTRKAGGGRPDSGATPPGTPPDSAPTPDGIQPEETRSPRARSRDPIPRTSHVRPHGCVTPLGLRPRVDVAWPGRPSVPGTLHVEFRQKLGGDEDAADRALHTWYPTVAAAWEDRAIGDDDFRFWRARFREWVGTTVVSDQDASALARKIGPTSTADDDWFNECQRLHGGRCNGSGGHRVQMAIAGEKAAVAV